MKRIYLWDGEHFVEQPPEEPVSYADLERTKAILNAIKDDELLRLQHPGQYL